MHLVKGVLAHDGSAARTLDNSLLQHVEWAADAVRHLRPGLKREVQREIEPDCRVELQRKDNGAADEDYRNNSVVCEARGAVVSAKHRRHAEIIASAR